MRDEVRRGLGRLAQAAVLGLVFLLGTVAEEGSMIRNASAVLGLVGVILAAFALVLIAKGLLAQPER